MNTPIPCILITTTYRGATDTRPSCIVVRASNSAKKLKVSWDYSLNTQDNHAAACIEYMYQHLENARVVGESSGIDGIGYAYMVSRVSP